MTRITGNYNGKQFHGMRSAFATDRNYDCPITGTIYGCLLNEVNALKANAPRFTEKPYIAPPLAPILYIKPENTKAGHGAEVTLPPSASHVHVGATLGVIIGKTASSVRIEDALHYVSGYTIVSDLSLPHDSFFRPAVKYRALDGFNPAGPWIVNKDAVSDPNNLLIVTTINNEQTATFHTSQLVRSVEQLISEVTEFITLQQGDCLLVGTPSELPLAKQSDQIDIYIAEIGQLNHSIAAEKKEAG